MKPAIIVTLTFVCLLLAGASVRSQTSFVPPVYEIHLVQVADTSPRENVWQITGRNAPTCVYKTLQSPELHRWVEGLPIKTIIEYRPVGLPLLGKAFKIAKPAQDPEKEVAEFAKFCETQKVVLYDRFPVL